MSPSLWVAIALGLLVAYANGSNDVSEGNSTLAHSSCEPRRWAARPYWHKSFNW